MADRPNFDAVVHEETLTEPLYSEKAVAVIAVYNRLGAPRWNGVDDFADYVKAFAAWERENSTALRKAGIRGSG